MKQLHFYSKVFLPLFLIITACSKSDLSEHGAKAHSCGFLGKVVDKQIQQLINIQQYSPAGLALQVSKQPDTEDTEEKSLELFFEEFVDFVNQADEEEALEDINLAESCGIGINQSLQSFLERTYKWSGKEYTPLHYSAEEGKLNFVKLL
ncbi:MAG: hypothetical protein AAF706_02035, partial [Bacteroidota bacterium]